VAEKNKFFQTLGNALQPEDEDKLSGLNKVVTAQQILYKVKK
jgi:hypothetical protein